MDKKEFILISPVHVANTILKIAKEKNMKITPTKLNNLIYLVYVDYLYHTQTKLFSEQFSYSYKGPLLPSVYFKFSIWADGEIKEFGKDAKGQIFIVDSSILDSIINVNLDLYGNFYEEELILITNQKNNIKQYRNSEEILKRYSENKNVSMLQLKKTQNK